MTLRPFLLLVLIGLAALGGWWWTTSDESMTRNEDTTTTISDQDAVFFEVPALTSKRIHTSNAGARYTIDIDYPEVTLSTHPALAKEANDVIGGFLKETQANFVTQTKELFSPSVPVEFSSDLTMNWTPLLVSPELISVRFEYSAYVAGAAHPDHRTRILNYDLANHRLLAPTDLFASTTLALPFLSDFSRDALRAQMADEPEDLFRDMTLPGTEPTHENFQEIGVTQEGLLVVFNPYQVAPYARGTIEVPISLSALEVASGTPGLSPAVAAAIRLSKENFRAAVEETPVAP